MLTRTLTIRPNSSLVLVIYRKMTKNVNTEKEKIQPIVSIIFGVKNKNLFTKSGLTKFYQSNNLQ